MKFDKGNPNSPAGDFGSKALIESGNGWVLTDRYFFSLTEAVRYAKGLIGTERVEVKWPVEKYDDSFVYVPAPEELK